MSFDSEDFKDYREQQKERRLKRLPVRTEAILALSELGYIVDKKTDYHFRINETLDIFPIHVRFHNIKTNKRGGFHPDNLINLVNNQLTKNK